ncbi:MAG: hypothetical protein AMS23_06570, partial [Bacteroides sp. SM1_62]
MMKLYEVIGCAILLAFSLSNKAWAGYPGYPDADSSLALPGSLNERIQVMTDRHIYAVGEKILFAGFNIIPPELDTSCWSKVLYLELLTPGGKAVAHGKFPMSRARASGYLPIPEDLLTGNYYLVAYTKWMRNFSPVNFHYQLVKIINPYTPQLETSNFSSENGQTIDCEQKPLKEEIICNTDKSSYHQREEVK